MRKPRQPYDKDEREALRERFDRWSRRMTRERGRFFKKELRAELRLGSHLLKSDSWLLAPFFSNGSLVSLGRQRGFARTGATGSAATLADLVALAERRRDESFEPEGGPREKRAIKAISTGQFDRIEGVARLIAQALTGDKRNWAAVTAENWTWDPGLRGGEGDWVITERVAEWSDARSRRKKMARGKAWTPADNTGRSNHVASVRLLLDLAATHGMIERTAAHGPAWVVHAAEWASVVKRWLRRILGRTDGRSKRKVRQGLRTLARYATQFGALSPGQADWPAIRERIASDHDRGSLSYDQMNWARYAYRHLVELGEIDAPEWPVKQSRRTSLVATAISDDAAATGDFSSWTTLDGRPLIGREEGLVESPYGLRAWRTWATAARQGELRAKGLPERKWPDPTATPQQKRRLAREPDFLKLSPTVVEHRLFGINLYAGYLAREHGIDWTREDLRAMTDPTHVEGFGRYLARTGSGGRNKSSLASTTFFALATIACPFLEAVAWQRGDEEVAGLMRKRAADLTVDALEWKLEDGPKDKLAIEGLWDVTGRGGWATLELLRDALVDEVVRRAGGLGLEEQISALRSGEAEPWGEQWAQAGKLAVLLTVERNVPLRVRSLSELDFSMWKNHGKVPRAVGGSDREEPRRWEGAIQLVVPGEVMKSGRRFAPWLISENAVGEPEAERRLCRPLLELYFMKGGMRDELLSVCEYAHKGRKGRRVVAHRETYESDRIFPATVRHMRLSPAECDARQDGDGFRYDEEALSSWFSSNVLRFGPRVGLDTQSMEEQWGCTTIHVLRLLFGTYWAPRNLKHASTMLAHASTTVTEAMYCATDETTVNLDALEEAARTSGVGTPSRADDVQKAIEARALELAERMVRERLGDLLPSVATGDLSAA